MLFLLAICGASVIDDVLVADTDFIYRYPIGTLKVIIDKRDYQAVTIQLHGPAKSRRIGSTSVRLGSNFKFAEASKFRPSVISKFLNGNLYLFLIQDHLNDGVYEYKRVSAYKLAERDSALIAERLCEFDFSGQGGFMVSGEKIYTFDAVELDLGHGSPHRYNLRAAKLRPNAKLRLVGETKRRYAFWTEKTDHPEIIAAKDDPLQEFGLKWRWWGQK
jgi:hypothetical protein